MTETKTLFLLRHAKPVWQTATITDLERPLCEAGRIAANAIGKLLSKERIDPELIMSSPAVRAKETIEIAHQTASLSAGVQYHDAIYEATASQLHALVVSIEPQANTALMVGHNPGMEAFLRSLTKKHREFAAGTLAKIMFPDTKWTEITAGSGKLEWLLNPGEN